MASKMTCKACGGPVFYDTMHTDEGVLDLFCLMHGKRWHLRKSHPLARYVIERIGQ